MTTLRGELDKGYLPPFAFFSFDVVDRVLDGLDLLGVFVGNLDVEGLFELHHQLDHVQRIRAQVFLEAGAGGYFGLVHLQLLDDDLLYLLFNGHACFSSCFWNFENLSGAKLNPAPPAYNTGPWQGNTTIAPKKLRMAPKLQVYRAGGGV